MKAGLLKLSEKDPKAIDRLTAQLDELQVALARRDPNEFVQYVLRDEETQAPIKQAPYHEALQTACSESKYAVIWGHVELGKELAVSTLIPTPSGYKEIQHVGVGSYVFAMDGTPTRVISKSAVRVPEACYSVRFSDGTSIDAGADHQWLVCREHDRHDTVVMTTSQLVSSSEEWHVPLTEPLRDGLENWRWGVVHAHPVKQDGRWRRVVGLHDTSVLCETLRALGAYVKVDTSTGTVQWDYRSTKAITSIEPIDPTPMVCIGVDHPTHTYLAGRHYTVTHNCVTADTALWTPDGTPITAIQAKERWEKGDNLTVLSINTKTGKQEWVKVKSVQYDSHAPCVRVTTRTGLETKVSWNHPFFIERGGELGWCAAGELRQKDVVLTAGNVSPGEGYEEKPLSSQLAFDLGVLFGLACRNVRVPRLFAHTQELSINVSVEISRTNENVPDYLRVLREMAERFGWRIIYHDSFNDLSLNRTTHVVVEGLRDWFERLGIHFTRFWNGRQWIQEFYSDNGGFFPSFIYQADAVAVRSFLSGFLLNRFKFEEPASTTREIGIFLPIIASAVMTLARRAGVRVTRSWGNFRAKVRVNKKHTVITEENQYTRLHARRVDIYPLMKEAHDRIRNRYTHLAHTLEGYYLGYVDPGALGLEGDRRAFVEHRPPEPVVRDTIACVQPIGIQPVYAITIDSEDHTHVTDHILTHNTQQISIGRVLWEIGNNPSIRVCIIQATEGLAEDVVTTIKNYIEHSPEYHRVFPHIRRGDEWTSKSFTIERPASIKDPTVIAAGIHGNVLGRRFDLVIVDDGVTGDNSDTDYMRKDVYDWLVSTPMSRLTRQARFWVVGNAWHNCLLPYQEVVTANRGVVTAEDLSADDVVMVGPGQWETPKVVGSRLFSGDAYHIKVAGSPSPLALTWNHKVLTTAGERLVKDLQVGDELVIWGTPQKEDLPPAPLPPRRVPGTVRPPPKAGAISREALEAALREHRTQRQVAAALGVSPACVCRLIKSYSLKGKGGTRTAKSGWHTAPEWWRFFGYWLAEGVLDGNRITLTFGRTDNPREVMYAQDAARCFTVATGIRAKVLTHCSEGRADTLRVRVSANECVRWLSSAGGSLSRQKKLATWVESAPTSLLREMLLGYHRGDGSSRGEGKKGVSGARFATSSAAIAYGLQRILASLRVTSSVYRRNVPGGDAYEVRIQAQSAFMLGLDVRPPTITRSATTKRVTEEGHAAHKIVGVEKFHYTGLVYDMETSTHWFAANNFVVHNCDAMHLFAKMSGFNVYKFPARDQVTGEPLWPERWSRQRILDFASARPPWEVARALDCKPRSSETGRFRYAWFERALDRGKGLFGTDTMCWGLASLPKGAMTFTGVDLGFSEAAGTDVTAIVTLMTTPEGRITLINIDQGNWDGLEIVERIARAHHRFKSYVYVESIIAQRWIIQNLRAKYPNIPVFPFQTRGTGTMRNKRHVFFGVESLATELAQDLWDIPKASTGAIDPNIQKFIDECMAYHPDDHTGDLCMGAWIALQGARKQTGITGAFGSAEHSLYAFVEDDMSPEERREKRAFQEVVETQKATEDWWGDIAKELGLPKRSAEQVAEDLGL